MDTPLLWYLSMSQSVSVFLFRWSQKTAHHSTGATADRHDWAGAPSSGGGDADPAVPRGELGADGAPLEEGKGVSQLENNVYFWCSHLVGQ